jgi:hypothetical protein
LVYIEKAGASDDLVEQLSRRVVLDVGEVEDTSRFEVGRGDERLDEEDRVDDLQRVGAAGDRAHLGVHVCVVPIDLGLGAEAVVGQFLERDEVGPLLGPGTAAELEPLPGRDHGRAHDVVAGEDRLGVLGLGVPLVGARLRGEAGDGAVLHQDQAVALGDEDAAAVADHTFRAVRVRAAPGVLPLRDRREQRCRWGQTARDGVEVLPLIGQRSAECSDSRLNKSHQRLLRLWVPRLPPLAGPGRGHLSRTRSSY